MACTRRWKFLYVFSIFHIIQTLRVVLWQRAKPATKREMSQFHTDEYVDFLYRINPDNAAQFAKEQVKCEF